MPEVCRICRRPEGKQPDPNYKGLTIEVVFLKGVPGNVGPFCNCCLPYFPVDGLTLFGLGCLLQRIEVLEGKKNHGKDKENQETG